MSMMGGAVGGGGGLRGGGMGASSVADAAASLKLAATDRPLLRRIARLFRPYRRDLIVIAALIVVTSGLGIVGPLLVKVVFDRALFVPGGPKLGLLYWLLGAMIAAPVAASLVGLWQSYLTNSVGQRVLRDLRSDLYRHLQSLSLRFFTASRTGDIQSRIANDVGGLQSVITDTASTILSNAVTLISTIIAMSLLSWQLTLLSLAITPGFIWLTGKGGQDPAAVVGTDPGRAVGHDCAHRGDALGLRGAAVQGVRRSGPLHGQVCRRE